MERSTGLADDRRASADARRELGADYDPAVVQAFLERVDREIDHRPDRRIAAARAGSTDWTTHDRVPPRSARRTRAQPRNA